MYRTLSYSNIQKVFIVTSIAIISIILFTSSILSAASTIPKVIHTKNTINLSPKSTTEELNTHGPSGGKTSPAGMIQPTYIDNRQDKETPKDKPSDLRQIQYSFTLQNKTNRLLERAEFWTYAPAKETATQRTVKIESSHPYQLILDDLGNQILYFNFENLPPYATKIITIKAFLELSSIPNRVSVKNLEPFLQPEKYIESDNPELAGFANKFSSAEPGKTAQNIFTWVADNLEYAGYLKDNHGALYALKNKKGDCTEYMSLFMALARANQVPSRGIGGYIVTANAILKPYEYHNWAEFYDEGVWNIVDPQNKVFMQDQSHYIAMKIIGESENSPMGDYDRYRFAGDGLKVQMNY